MACNIDKAVKDIKVLLRSDGIDKIEGSEAVKTALVKLQGRLEARKAELMATQGGTPSTNTEKVTESKKSGGIVQDTDTVATEEVVEDDIEENTYDRLGIGNLTRESRRLLDADTSLWGRVNEAIKLEVEVTEDRMNELVEQVSKPVKQEDMTKDQLKEHVISKVDVQGSNGIITDEQQELNMIIYGQHPKIVSDINENAGRYNRVATDKLKERQDKAKKYSNNKTWNMYVDKAGTEVDALDTRTYNGALLKVINDVVKPSVEVSNSLALSKVAIGQFGVIAGKYKNKKVTIASMPSNADIETAARNYIQEEWMEANAEQVAKWSTLGDAEYNRAVANNKELNDVIDSNQKKVVTDLVKILQDVKGSHAVLHEFVHAGSVEFMRENPEHEATKRMEELYALALENEAKINAIADPGANGRGYWTTSIDEFIAEGLSNPSLIHALAKVKTRSMNGISKNLFKDMVDALLRMVGVARDNNIHEYMMDGFMAMMEEQAIRQDRVTDTPQAKKIQQEHVFNEILDQTPCKIG